MGQVRNTVMLQDVHHVARVSHKCWLCWREITPGESYRRRRVIIDGKPLTYKECHDCEFSEYR